MANPFVNLQPVSVCRELRKVYVMVTSRTSLVRTSNMFPTTGSPCGRGGIRKPSDLRRVQNISRTLEKQRIIVSEKRNI